MKIDKLAMIIFSEFFKKINKYFLVLLGGLAVVPLLLLSFFNNPGSDDFDYEFKRPFQEIIQTQVELYNNWSGRFFSIGFMTINPELFIKFSVFRFYPIIIISLFIFVLFWFFKLIFSQENNVTVLSIVSFFVFLFLFQIPDCCQAFFWYSSSICYQFGIVLFLVFVSSFIKYKKSKKLRFLFLAIVAVIASIGSNEILMLLLLFSSIFYVLIKFYYLPKIDFIEIFLVFIIVSFSIIVIFAPGNDARILREGEVLKSHNLLLSIVKSFFYLGKYFIKWMPIILLTAYLFKNKVYEISNRLNNRFFIHPILCFVIISILIFSCFFIGFWIKNYVLPDRALNSVFFFFLLFMLYFVCCSVLFYKDKFDFVKEINKKEHLFLGMILVLLTFSETPISEAYFDLLSGKAYKYDKELSVRNRIIESSKEIFVQVPMLLNCPKTIYNSEVMGLTTDKNNWKNIELSKYYKKTIVIIPVNKSVSE
ncbi:DUF6056 family protein [Flavobacterium sp. 5]|uniref:DUF6056 family protein n=1 Tax=Flavobacterium sp. 5 TaxID=2035199 RepID=UPI000C2BB102|nr:DUF6056 family protein [Flavobacterium sp. 5]PKB15702.1 hypothetical protein CLU82_0789 [Flavobacterium sp. 5]